MIEPIQMTTTSDQRDVLVRIATVLVEQRLVACAQIDGPLTSIYRWQNNVESKEEWRCTFKTGLHCVRKISQVLKQHHDYDVPELIATPIVGGSAMYLEWLSEQLDPEA